MHDDAPRGEPGAVLHPDKAAPLMDISRHFPRDSLRDFIEYHWIVRWRINDEHRQQVLPQPKIHLAAEHGRLYVHGVNREPFYRTFAAPGQVIGVAFRPGGFRPFLRSSVGALEGRVVAAGDLWASDDRPVATHVLGSTSNADMVVSVEEYLEALAPEPDPTLEEIAGIVAYIENDTSVHRVDQVAKFAHTTVRTLQRLFIEYVGISPKWVIQRRRLIDAAEQAHNGPVVWAQLADQLGFSDQAHLIRAWTAAVGTPPATYVRETRGWRPRA